MNNLITLVELEPIGERFFIGILTALTIYLFFSYLDKRSDKRTKRKEESALKIKKEILYQNTIRNIAKGYTTTLKHVIDGLNVKSQLLDKCNPRNFLSPYNPQKVNIATMLYAELQSGKKETPLNQIWDEAEAKLGIFLDAETIFNELSNIFNPNRFVGNNFNETTLLVCNRAYDYIQNNRTNLRNLLEFTENLNINSPSNNSNKLIIPIVCDFELVSSNENNVVDICGMYQMELIHVNDDAYYFYPINNNSAFTAEPDLMPFTKIYGINQYYLEIPVSNCKRYEPSEVIITTDTDSAT